MEYQIEKIRAFAVQEGVSRSKLARDAGLSPNALAQMWSADWRPQLGTVHKLLDVLPGGFVVTNELAGRVTARLMVEKGSYAFES